MVRQALTRPGVEYNRGYMNNLVSEIENRDGLLLPGMQGYASVYCGKRSLVWIYFHKPWYALRRLLVSVL